MDFICIGVGLILAACMLRQARKWQPRLTASALRRAAGNYSATGTLLLATLLLAGPARSNPSWVLYEGDPITSFYNYNMYTGANATNIYEYTDFAVPAGFKWDVSDIVVDLGVISAATITAFDWELRTGMNGSNGGTKIASGKINGDGTGYRTALTGMTVNGGVQVYQYVFPVNNATLADLTSGQTYWLTIYPEVSDGYNIWLTGTNHVNEVHSLLDNRSENYWYTWADPGAAGFSTDLFDYALGLEGTQAAPEPRQALPLALILFLLGAIRCRGAGCRAC